MAAKPQSLADGDSEDWRVAFEAMEFFHFPFRGCAHAALPKAVHRVLAKAAQRQAEPNQDRLATAASDQVVDLQVALQDVVLDGVEDKADVVCVGGAGEVRVDYLLLVEVEAGKRVQNERLGR